MRVEPISQATQERALEYLARSPFLNVYLSHVISHDAAPTSSRNIAVVLDGAKVAGVAYLGRHIVLAAEPSAIAPLAAYALSYRSVGMIIGPHATVAAFWELVRGAYGRPRLVRDRQLVMAVDRRQLRPGDGRVTVRLATSGEWSAVADSSASMIAQELEYGPRRDAQGFDAGVRQMIARKLWWVGVAEGRLCFFCSVGPWSEQTAQMQGIWTPPALRGRGLATASLAAICDRLLELTPTLSLYVNDFNEAAVALYRRVGFEHVGDFTTILF